MKVGMKTSVIRSFSGGLWPTPRREAQQGAELAKQRQPTRSCTELGGVRVWTPVNEDRGFPSCRNEDKIGLSDWQLRELSGLSVGASQSSKQFTK